MTGKYLLSIGFIFFFCCKISAQESCMPYIKGYRCYEFSYFDSLNQIHKKSLGSTTKRYEVYASFKLDTNGNVIGLQLKDLPVLKSPKKIKAYVTKLLKQSNGHWEPVTSNGKKVISGEIMYCFSFRRKDRTIAESEVEDKKLLEYFFSEANGNEMLNRFIVLGGKTVFVFY